MSGPRFADLDHLSASLAAVDAMDDVDTVILHIDSPGGQVVGLEEIAADIADLRATKRVVAYTDLQMASAAYWIACACDEITASPSAIVGSIGTYIAALDSSRAFELDGLELKLFRDGEIKAIGHPGKRWTEEEEAFLRQMVATVGARFKDFVRSSRGAVADANMQGQWWHASDAPALLIDALHRNVNSVLTDEATRIARI
jgi:signal peptide peptidase SppA